MLSEEDNERLVRVGRGTPAGELFRRYWQPALLAAEVPEPDGAPVRVRLLGEDLVAFRDSSGTVGLVDAYCPHRRAPLFFGRNENHGLRCVYHGWQFSADGECMDLPSEPADSPMRSRIRIKAYPTIERGGIVWTYMGPAAERPPAPDYEWTRAPQTHRGVSKSYQASNYLQGLEGGLDTAHVSFLHNNRLGSRDNLFSRDGAPRIEVFDTDYGYTYVSRRNASAENEFVRVYQYLMPFQQMRPNVAQPTADVAGRKPRYDGHLWVPIDDTQTFVYNWLCGIDAGSSFDESTFDRIETGYGRGRADYIPGTFRLKANASNDYLIDRAAQRSETFTGIRGVNTQDMALQEGMGAIVARGLEHLGTSDRAIVAMRRLLLEATYAVARGERPRGVDATSYRSARPYDGLVPKGADWREMFRDGLTPKW